MYKNELFWGKPEKRSFPTLKQNIEADYLIVGGGITGLAAAYFLTQYRKKRVVIIEKNTVGSGSTGHSAGMLVHDPEHADWHDLLTTIGSGPTKTYFKAHVAAAKLVKRIITEHAIACDFYEHDYLHLSAEPSGTASTFYKQYQTVRRVLDPELELLQTNSLANEFATDFYTAAKRSQQHNISVNPLRFARGFAKHLETKGVQIYEHTTFLKKRSATEVLTSGGTITTAQIIYCRGTSEVRSDLTPFLTTIGITRRLTKKELCTIGLFDKDMFTNDAQGPSFHYGKVTADNRLLIGYGDKPVSPKTFHHPAYPPHVKQIERFLAKTFPTLTLPLERAWSAPYALTTQALPVVELQNKNELIINGAGLQLGCIATASYGVSKLLGKSHPLDELYT